MPDTMRAMQVPEADADFELVEREVPSPGPGEALVKVEACGVCHSDSFAKSGGYPGVTFPVVPGHEVAGTVAALGEGVEGWEEGQRVGVGWFGGNCGHCEPCRRGDLIGCQNMEIPGVTMDGGYAEYVVVSARALAAIPDDLSSEDAAPLLCAGITTYNALRHSGAVAGDLVAVLGVGGLGHLGVQFAAKLGFETVAIARGAEKGELARELGANHYIDSTASDPAEELQKLGGAKVVLATVTNAAAMSGCDRRAWEPRQAHRRWRVDGSDRGPTCCADRRQQVDRRPRIRNVAGFRGHARLQRVERHPAANRDDAPGARRRGLRADDGG